MIDPYKLSLCTQPQSVGAHDVRPFFLAEGKKVHGAFLGADLAGKIEQSITALAEPVVEQLGYELVEVEFAKEGPDYVLTVFINKPEGITIDDCEIVSKAIDPLIEEADPIEQQYFLSVSSVGLDRPLKTAKDFHRNLGKTITVKLYAPINKTKEFTGVLRSADDQAVVLECAGSEIELPMKSIAVAKPFINFN